MTLVIIHRVASKINAHVWHHDVASPDIPTATEARGAHQGDAEGSNLDRLIKKLKQEN